MEIVDIVKLISDGGISLVLLGLTIWYVINLLTNRKRNDENDLERLKQYDNDQREKNLHWEEIVASLVAERLQEDHLKEEPTNNAINERITGIMQNALLEGKCSRVLQFSYHNGGKDYEGRSYQRMSCINEVLETGLYPIQSKYNNMFRTSLFSLYQSLNSHNYFNIPDVEAIKTSDPGTYYALTQDNIKSIFGCGIHNKNSDIIGFILFCFSEPQQNIHGIVSSLKKCAYQIEGVYMTM